MITKRVLWVLIIVTTAAFLFVYLASQQVLIAVFALGLGLSWLGIEIKGDNPITSLFFLAFLALALVGSLSNALITLLGLSAALAAWDLSRFRTRIADEVETDLLENRHLQKLAITVSAGYVIALLPVFIHLSLNFLLFSLVTLLAVFALRQAMLYFRSDRV